MLFLWRSLPHVYQTVVDNPWPPSEWEVYQWLKSYLDDIEEEYAIFRVVEVGGVPVGYVLARDLVSGVPEVGLVIAKKELWETGVSREAGESGWGILRDRGFAKVKALTRKENTRISHFMEGVGYEKVREDSDIVEWGRDL